MHVVGCLNVSPVDLRVRPLESGYCFELLYLPLTQILTELLILSLIERGSGPVATVRKGWEQ